MWLLSGKVSEDIFRKQLERIVGAVATHLQQQGGNTLYTRSMRLIHSSCEATVWSLVLQYVQATQVRQAEDGYMLKEHTSSTPAACIYSPGRQTTALTTCMHHRARA